MPSSRFGVDDTKITIQTDVVKYDGDEDTESMPNRRITMTGPGLNNFFYSSLITKQESTSSLNENLYH